MDNFRRPRLSVDITEEQDQKLTQYLDHGMRKVVFGLVVDDLLAMIDKHGAGHILGFFVERSITLKDICKFPKKE